MPWCPNCKEEYRDGFVKCAQCGADLVDKPPQNDTETEDIDLNAPVDPCLLISVSDKIQGGLVKGLLDDAGIPFLIKDRESGGFMNVYMGFSVYGIDIYVDKSNYDRAKELIDSCMKPDAIEEPDIVEEPDTEDDNEPLDDGANDRSFVVRKNIMRVIIFIIVLSFVLELMIGGFSVVKQFFRL